MKIIIRICFLLFTSLLCKAQPTGQKEFYNKNCKLPSNATFLTNKLKSTDKELSTYLLTNYPEYKLHSAVEFNLLFTPNAPICCYRTVVVEPDQISKIQKDTLLQRIIRFPGFNNMNIKTPKKLLIFVGPSEIHKPECTFFNLNEKK
ncbi:MAG: hypothetical protein ACK50A_00970 [Sphingobacteriaceae bacterium]|jgi:hypothetical protein